MLWGKAEEFPGRLVGLGPHWTNKAFSPRTPPYLYGVAVLSWSPHASAIQSKVTRGPLPVSCPCFDCIGYIGEQHKSESRALASGVAAEGVV